jgi:hypothetical protein
MPQLRRALGPVAALWLLCQLGTGALVPVALLTAADSHTLACTCGHGADEMCPMHHKRPSSPVRCAMQAAGESGTAALTTLVGLSGLIPESTPAIVAASATPNVAAVDAHLIGERPVPPDPPPPRA